MKRLSAIFRKEVQDVKTNSQALIMIVFPLIFAVLFSRMGMNGMGGMLTMMTLIFTAGFIQSLLIAEEKEKYTLRVLMLSPASPVEILLGKSVLTLCMTVGICFINFLIIDELKGNIGGLVLVITLSTLLFLCIGTMIGLAANSVAQTSVIGLPILMGLYLGAQFEPFVKSEWLKTIIGYFPTKNISDAINALIANKSFAAVDGELINIIICLVLTLVLTIFTYKKKQLD